MYPKTPEFTDKQHKKLIELLETIGSGGKGCLTCPELTVGVNITPKMAEKVPNYEFMRKIIVPATNNAESLPGVKGTVSHVVGGKGDRERYNK